MDAVTCNFCKHGREVSDECGKLHVQKLEDKTVAAHKKCMQYSAKLIQYKFNNFGGFKISKVEEEIKRGSKLKCSVCKADKKEPQEANGGTCGCAVNQCKKTFHYLCAHRDSNAITKRLQVKQKPPVVLYRVFCGDKHQEKFLEALSQGKPGTYSTPMPPRGTIMRMLVEEKQKEELIVSTDDTCTSEDEESSDRNGYTCTDRTINKKIGLKQNGQRFIGLEEENSSSSSSLEDFPLKNGSEPGSQNWFPQIEEVVSLADSSSTSTNSKSACGLELDPACTSSKNSPPRKRMKKTKQEVTNELPQSSKSPCGLELDLTCTSSKNSPPRKRIKKTKQEVTNELPQSSKSACGLELDSTCTSSKYSSPGKHTKTIKQEVLNELPQKKFKPSDVVLIIQEDPENLKVQVTMKQKYLNGENVKFWTNLYKKSKRFNMPYMMLKAVMYIRENKHKDFIRLMIDKENIEEHVDFQDYILSLGLEGNLMETIRQSVFSKIKAVVEDILKKQPTANDLVEFTEIDNTHVLVIHVDKTLDPSSVILNFIDDTGKQLTSCDSGVVFYSSGPLPQQAQEANAIVSFISRKLASYSFFCVPNEPLLINSSLCMLEVEDQLRRFAIMSDEDQPNVVVGIRNVESDMLHFPKFVSIVFRHYANANSLENLILLIDLSKENARFDVSSLLQNCTFGRLNEDLKVYTAQNVSACVTLVLVHYCKGG